VNDSMPNHFTQGWLKRQALARVVELYAILSEEDQQRKPGEMRDGRLLRVQRELERRHFNGST
jgi:hypothetical protein